MIAIVTGASSGMGREFVKKLDKNEVLDEIWVVARRTERLEQLKGEIKTPLKVISCDLTNEQDMKNFNIDAVINGVLDPIIDALTTLDQAQRLAETAE